MGVISVGTTVWALVISQNRATDSAILLLQNVGRVDDFLLAIGFAEYTDVLLSGWDLVFRFGDGHSEFLKYTERKFNHDAIALLTTF